jgi:hypothetical protein
MVSHAIFDFLCLVSLEFHHPNWIINPFTKAINPFDHAKSWNLNGVLYYVKTPFISNIIFLAIFDWVKTYWLKDKLF